MSSRFPVVVHSITLEATGILSFDLRPVGGGQLPAFAAGAHVDVHLPHGESRSYSLFNAQHERHRYLLAVQREDAGRGGSQAMHQLAVGQQVMVSGPRNNFGLIESAAHSVLVAGGIGITPLWSMAQRLEALGRSWELYYCARTRSHAALLERIEALEPAARARVHLHFDQEPGQRLLDLAELQSRHAAGTHFYCCGPGGMLEAFQRATAGRPREVVHVEHFSSSVEAATSGGFTVQLARSSRSLPVQPGQSILQVLLDAGVDVPHSCRDGICGSCEVRVVAGEPDHRDLVLSPGEQATHRTMMVCCSGSKSPTLVLDL